ncbi:MAG: hypothetical protein IPM47_17675 [Sphingobacteriales bacterium]|nr:MAG: hypothetical protein IPM47_17675 [Sphingobacteriales bacterium]
MSYLAEAIIEKAVEIEVLNNLDENRLGSYDHQADTRSWTTPVATTNLDTWSASTSKGKDNDKDDKGGKD